MANNTFITAGANSWTAPVGVIEIDSVECWGGGGGAGGGYTGANAGGGGGGGAYASNNNITVSPGTSYSLYVGNFGAGGSGSANGSNGTASWFNNGTANVCLADFGVRGIRGRNSGTGGAGGAIANSTGSLRYQGGAGATRSSATGGGGGSSAGTGANGANGAVPAGGTAPAGGGSGGNGGGAGVAGNNGVQPGGGGGGGGNASADGGDGAVGKVIVTWSKVTFAIDATSVGSNSAAGEVSTDVEQIASDKEVTLTTAPNATGQVTAPTVKYDVFASIAEGVGVTSTAGELHSFALGIVTGLGTTLATATTGSFTFSWSTIKAITGVGSVGENSPPTIQYDQLFTLGTALSTSAAGSLSSETPISITLTGVTASTDRGGFTYAGNRLGWIFDLAMENG